MLFDANNKKEITPCPGDILEYDTELSLLRYIRRGPKNPYVVWHNRDDKQILPKLVDKQGLLAIGRTIGAIFGLSAIIDDSMIDAPHVQGRFWRVRLG